MIKFLCYLWWKSRGWKIEGQELSSIDKAVVIGVPHTSNWDFVTAMFLLYSLKLDRAKFAIKKEWLRFPFGSFFTSLGAIGIDRSQYKGKVSTTKVLADLFTKHERLLLMIAPEGTRKPKDNWKTGFYYTATEAQVPIVTLKANYTKRIIYMAEKVIHPSELEKDMREISSYFKDSVGHNQDNFKLDSKYI